MQRELWVRGARFARSKNPRSSTNITACLGDILHPLAGPPHSSRGQTLGRVANIGTQRNPIGGYNCLESEVILVHISPEEETADATELAAAEFRFVVWGGPFFSPTST